MINFVHDLLTLQNFTPYFSAGIGLADIKLKQTAINDKTFKNLTIFKIFKTHSKALAFQAGLGVTYPISQTIALDVSAKIHAIKDVKINYQKFDKNKGKQGEQVDKSTKQHLGMLDVTAGLIFNF
jgi:opacity protein-like surface antigen